MKKFLTVILAVLLALLTLTGSISVPLLCRPFYTLHVDLLALPDKLGLERGQILEAYRQVMDYCTGRSPVFSAGIFPFSQGGADHFADVQRLFLLNFRVLAVSLALLLLIAAGAKLKKWKPERVLGRGPAFWAAAGLGGTFLAVGGLAALDFDRAFLIFHGLLFPGKTNWVFYYDRDPVIFILPQIYFQNCALLILSVLLLVCGVLIALDARSASRKTKLPS